MIFLIAIQAWVYAGEVSVISDDGVTIHYLYKGKGDPTLVFAHGWSCDTGYWQDQIDYFSKTRQTDVAALRAIAPGFSVNS